MASATPVTSIARTPEASIAEASLPGLVIRPLRAPDDYGEMNRIANAERTRIGIPFTTTVDQVRDYYERPSHFVAARDVAIFELDGRIIGYVRGGINQVAAGPLVYEIVSFVDPEADAALVVPLMLSVAEHHLRRLADGEGASEKVFETIASGSVPEREQAVRAAGYEPIRHSYSMVRPSVDDVPDAELPPGLEIRDVRPEDMRRIWEAGVEAFRDAWGFVEPDEQEYQRSLVDTSESQTDLWRVAWDGDEVVGQVRGYINREENEQFDRRRGYTESISVRRPWRRRGVARALIAATIRLLRERGMTEVALGVDTENVTGALALYESCGYVPVSRFTTYRKPIA
jgi:mycothiol synthase